MMKRSEENIVYREISSGVKGRQIAGFQVLKSKLLKTVAQYIFRKVHSPSIFVMMHAELCFQKLRNKK